VDWIQFTETTVLLVLATVSGQFSITRSATKINFIKTCL